MFFFMQNIFCVLQCTSNRTMMYINYIVLSYINYIVLLLVMGIGNIFKIDDRYINIDR